MFGFESLFGRSSSSEPPQVHGPAPAHQPESTPAPQEADHAPAPGAGAFHPITAMQNGFDSVLGFGKKLITKVEDGARDVEQKVENGVHGIIDSVKHAWEHHQQVAAAEKGRDQLDEHITKLGVAITPEQKKRIADRTAGLSGDDLVKEMAALEGALKGKNADRALATYAEVDELASKSKDGKTRINSEVMSELVGGVSTSRTDGDRGQAGILGARSARDSAQGLLNMNKEEYAQTETLLHQAGKAPDGTPGPEADAGAEQALILKAVAARRDSFKHDVTDAVDAVSGGETANQAANREIAQFAKDIRGVKREDLIRSTSVIDIDDKNTSTTDPSNRKGGDTLVDNDGLFQRWLSSCGPTTSQMVRGEADPIYALKLRQNHFEDNDPNSEYAQEQKRVLEANGGGAVSRLGDNARVEITDKLDQMKLAKQVSGAEVSAMKKLMSGGKLDSSTRQQAQATLAKLRGENAGHPTDAELAAMKADAGKVDNGMGLEPALDTIAGDQTHLKYQNTGMGDASGNLPTTGQLAHVDEKLKDGQDVPIRIGYNAGGGHFMMVSDVRGAPGADRKYLVSDPWSGGTRWVAEADFKSGNFTTTTFDLGPASVSHVYGDKSQTF